MNEKLYYIAIYFIGKFQPTKFKSRIYVLSLIFFHLIPVLGYEDFVKSTHLSYIHFTLVLKLGLKSLMSLAFVSTFSLFGRTNTIHVICPCTETDFSQPNCE